ncbi:MAG: LysE family translocator [Pseudomonadota bacterium]
MTALFLGWLTFLLTSVAPGPSTLAIMATSLAHGRGAGLALSLGTCTGSAFWGVLSAMGMAALLTAYGEVLIVLKVLGAAYLLWIAVKAARRALSGHAPNQARPPTAEERGFIGYWKQGVAIHLVNPKAVLGWTAVIAIGAPADAGPAMVPVFLAGCTAIALVVNPGYALVFSSAPLVGAYLRARRAIEGCFAALFAAAGVSLLAWRPA